MPCSHSFAWHRAQTLANHALSLIHQNLGTLVSEPRNPAPKQINSRTSRRAPPPASFRAAHHPGCELVVATFRTKPITGLALHGLAVRVVANPALLVIVIPTRGAEPIAGQPLLHQWPGSPAIPTVAIHVGPVVHGLTLWALPGPLAEAPTLRRRSGSRPGRAPAPRRNTRTRCRPRNTRTR